MTDQLRVTVVSPTGAISEAETWRASNSSINDTIDTASSTVTVGGPRSDHSPVNKLPAQGFPAEGYTRRRSR